MLTSAEKFINKFQYIIGFIFISQGQTEWGLFWEMAQGKMKVKCAAGKIMKRKQSGGSIKKQKGKTKKGQKRIAPKKQQVELSKMKKNYEKVLKQKIESEAAEKVSAAEPRSLKFVWFITAWCLLMNYLCK